MEAMPSSMTAKERAKPDVINAKRKIRIAKGSGTTVQEVNKLLKMHHGNVHGDEAAEEDGRAGQARGHVRQGRPDGALGGLAPARFLQGPRRRRAPLQARRSAVQPAPGFDRFGKITET